MTDSPPIGSIFPFFCSCRLPHAQAAITGVVKDASGGVLPGRDGGSRQPGADRKSPVGRERRRRASTGSSTCGPGTYSVTFTLPGFSTVKRDGIELTGTFVATVNADLKVGALEETITVTGETPIVDVQSAKGAADGQQGRPRGHSELAERGRHPGADSRALSNSTAIRGGISGR